MMGNAAARLLLLAVALMGLATIAFLPPFEGFDESAHFSYVQQIADTGTLPQVVRGKLSTDVEGYVGPLPTSIDPARSYHPYFAGDGGAVPQVPLRFAPGVTDNWQAQHAPFYYVVLAPFYALTRDAGMNVAMFTLRAVSWLTAFVGFAVGSWASLRALPEDKKIMAPVILGWPLLLPGFFPEMARLGNDSFCLLLMGIAWALLLRLLERRDITTAVWLSVALTLGFWTKAFFIPITGGIGLFVAYVAWRRCDRQLVVNGAVAVVAALILGGSWYVGNILATGGTGFLLADRPESFWSALMTRFDIAVLFRGLVGIAFSFAWPGTWSFARFHPIFTAPVVVMLGLGYLWWLLRLRRDDEAALAPLFIAGPVVAGLVVYLLTQMARPENANGAPGWYLHILQGPLAFALALGWRKSWDMKLLAGYALMFHAVCWMSQLSFFSGCALRPADARYIEIGNCFISFANLAAVTYPLLGSVLLVIAVASAARGSMVRS